MKSEPGTATGASLLEFRCVFLFTTVSSVPHIQAYKLYGMAFTCLYVCAELWSLEMQPVVKLRAAPGSCGLGCGIINPCLLERQ